MTAPSKPAPGGPLAKNEAHICPRIDWKSALRGFTFPLSRPSEGPSAPWTDKGDPGALLTPDRGLLVVSYGAKVYIGSI